MKLKLVHFYQNVHVGPYFDKFFNVEGDKHKGLELDWDGSIVTIKIAATKEVYCVPPANIMIFVPLAAPAKGAKA